MRLQLNQLEQLASKKKSIIVKIKLLKPISAIDYTKAYITHNGGTSLATIDENNNFVDLGTFVDDEEMPFRTFMGQPLARMERFI